MCDMCQSSNFVSCLRLAYSQPRRWSRVPPRKQRVSSYPCLASSAEPSCGSPKHSFSATRCRVACISVIEKKDHWRHAGIAKLVRYRDGWTGKRKTHCDHTCLWISSLFLLSFSRSASVFRAPRSWRYTDRSLFTICVAQWGGVGSSSVRIW